MLKVGFTGAQIEAQKNSLPENLQENMEPKKGENIKWETRKYSLPQGNILTGIYIYIYI